MLTDASSPQGRAARLTRTSDAIRALGLERRARSLADAAARLREVTADPAIEARLAESCGLSEEMVRWAMASTLDTVDFDSLNAIGAAAESAGGPTATPMPCRLSTTILAGNIVTAPIRAMFLPLLVGVPTLAKPSSREKLLPTLLAEAIDHVDSVLGQSCDVISLPTQSPELASILEQSDVISVYGSDATICEVRREAPATATVVPHGHGLGVAYVDGLPDDPGALESLARAIADDVAAYDQRGCLSPHAIYVEGGAKEASRLAEAIYEGLAKLSVERPRGPLPLESGAAQLQWRGVATLRGRLFEGDGFSVAVDGEGPPRVSPGYRNVAVHPCAGSSAFLQAMIPLGIHLKSIGLGGEALDVDALVQAMPSPLAPRLTPLGTMQRPPLDALADGMPATAGLLRYVEIRRR